MLVGQYHGLRRASGRAVCPPEPGDFRTTGLVATTGLEPIDSKACSPCSPSLVFSPWRYVVKASEMRAMWHRGYPFLNVASHIRQGFSESRGQGLKHRGHGRLPSMSGRLVKTFCWCPDGVAGTAQSGNDRCTPSPGANPNDSKHSTAHPGRRSRPDVVRPLQALSSWGGCSRPSPHVLRANGSD